MNESTFVCAAEPGRSKSFIASRAEAVTSLQVQERNSLPSFSCCPTPFERINYLTAQIIWDYLHIIYTFVRKITVQNIQENLVHGLHSVCLMPAEVFLSKKKSFPFQDCLQAYINFKEHILAFTQFDVLLFSLSFTLHHTHFLDCYPHLILFLWKHIDHFIHMYINPCWLIGPSD